MSVDIWVKQRLKFQYLFLKLYFWPSESWLNNYCVLQKRVTHFLLSYVHIPSMLAYFTVAERNFQNIGTLLYVSVKGTILKSSIKFKHTVGRRRANTPLKNTATKTQRQKWDACLNTSMTSVCNLQETISCKKREQLLFKKVCNFMQSMQQRQKIEIASWNLFKDLFLGCLQPDVKYLKTFRHLDLILEFGNDTVLCKIVSLDSLAV